MSLGGHRKALRAAVRAALAGDARMSGLKHIKAWFRLTDVDQFPAYTVFIPRDPSQVSDDIGVERRTVVQVIVKRAGDESLEDDLDDDVGAIEAAVLPVLRALSDQIAPDLDGSEFSFSGEGKTLVGQAVVQFTAQLFQEIPSG